MTVSGVFSPARPLSAAQLCEQLLTTSGLLLSSAMAASEEEAADWRGQLADLAGALMDVRRSLSSLCPEVALAGLEQLVEDLHQVAQQAPIGQAQLMGAAQLAALAGGEGARALMARAHQTWLELGVAAGGPQQQLAEETRRALVAGDLPAACRLLAGLEQSARGLLSEVAAQGRERLTEPLL